MGLGKTNKTIVNILCQAFLVMYAIIVIYPIFIMVATSLKSNLEIFSNPLGFPMKIVISGYAYLAQNTYFPRYFLNSFIVTMTSITIVIIISTMVSYAIARYKYKFAGFLYMFILIGMMIPLRLGILNLTNILSSLNLYDNLFGLILVYTAMTIPFTMFIITGFIKIIPIQLEEAAYVDGCTTFNILLRIIVPTLKPAIATAAVYNFIQIWNDVYFPLILTRNESIRTLSLGITMFFGTYSTDWNLAFSALTVSALPTLIFYFFVSKYLVKGLMAGALKG